MGYTHYWRQRADIPAEKWAAICADVRALIERLPDGVSVAAEFDSNEPALVTDDEIRFNGIGDNGHETFVLSRVKPNGGFEFCKTAQKPYDVLVCAVLIVAASHKAPMRISSDGEPADWESARALVAAVLGKSLAVPLAA